MHWNIDLTKVPRTFIFRNFSREELQLVFLRVRTLRNCRLSLLFKTVFYNVILNYPLLLQKAYEGRYAIIDCASIKKQMMLFSQSTLIQFFVAPFQCYSPLSRCFLSVCFNSASSRRLAIYSHIRVGLCIPALPGCNFHFRTLQQCWATCRLLAP